VAQSLCYYGPRPVRNAGAAAGGDEIAARLAALHGAVRGRGGDTRTAALISIVAAAAWLVAGGAFFAANTRTRSREVWTVRSTETA
jgi:hypothetical protein